jgi:PAS domain S-box-containing protein
MQKVMDAMGFAAVIVQGETFCDVNPAAADLSGYTREELMGMRFWEIVHPEYRDEVKATGLLYQSEEIAPQCREIKIICKDGREAWIHAIVSSTEINGRPAAVAALLEMPARNVWESHLHYVVDESPDLICRWQEGGLEKALQEITKNRELFYDPAVVDACLGVFGKRDFSCDGRG